MPSGARARFHRPWDLPAPYSKIRDQVFLKKEKKKFKKKK